MADTPDSKSGAPDRACGFDSHLRHCSFAAGHWPVVWSKPRYLLFDMKTGLYLAGFYPPGADDIRFKGLIPDRK
jgi:hypothetical protein